MKASSMTRSKKKQPKTLMSIKFLFSPSHYCNFAMMKHLLFLLLGGYLLVSFAACKQHRPYDGQLAHIDSLADVNPDSADILLSRSPLLREGGVRGGSDKARILLRIKTDDKLYRPVTHYRDTILQLIDYFEHHPKVLPSLLGSTGPALPYLYAGRIFADLGDAPQALDYFQEALDVQPVSELHSFGRSVLAFSDQLSGKKKGQGELPNEAGLRLAKQRGLLYSFIAELFFYQKLNSEAISRLKEANYWADLANDTLDLLFNYRDIAEQYKYLENYDSCIFYYHKALHLADKIENQKRQKDIKLQLARVYNELGKYKEAWKYMQPAILNIDTANISATYSIASNIYRNLGKIDSATYYLTQLLEVGNIYGKRHAHIWLSEFSLQHGNIYSAIEHVKQYKVLDDSIRARDNAETVARMHAAYNYQKHKQKAADLELANTKKQNTINIISILSIIVAITAFFFFRSLAHRQKIADQRLMELNAKLEEQSKIGNDEELKVKVAKYEKEIAALSHQLQETDNDRLSIRTELESLISKLSDEKIALEHAFRRASNRQKNQEEAVFSFSETSIYIFFAQSAKEKKVVPAEKWAEFIASAETNYFREFKNNLTNLCRISEHEYKMCLLFKSGFSKADIAKLLLIDRSAVGHAFARMYARSTKHKGTVSDWEKILQAL